MRSGLMFALAGLVAACGTPTEENAAETTGAALTVDYFGDTDVVGFHFTVTRVPCDAYDDAQPETFEFNVDLVDGIFPGQIEFLETTLDPASRHLGSDLFVTLDPGCYDVVATPASAIDGDYWTPSYDCGSASIDGVEVFAEQTTDVTLLSQCLGDPIGALDVLVLLNNPPEFELEIDEKFNYECEPVEVCATIIDPNDDPIEVVWSQVQRRGLTSRSRRRIPRKSIGFDRRPPDLGSLRGHRDALQRSTSTTSRSPCTTCCPTAERIEDHPDVQAATTSPLNESNAMLTFPIYTNWIEEPLCFDE